VAISGLLSPDAGATFMAAIEAEATTEYRSARSRQDGDVRTPGQRRADALVALSRRYLDSGEAPLVGGMRWSPRSRWTPTGCRRDADGMPTGYGRRIRAVPPTLRKVIVVRDQGCRFPGCDRPPSWSQAHHIVHWSHGGKTDADNLLLLCTHHHHAVHEGGFGIQGSPQRGSPIVSGLRFTRPDGSALHDRGRVPRRQ